MNNCQRYLEVFVWPLVVPILIGSGSSTLVVTKLEERMANVERNITRHEEELLAMRKRDDAQENRITRTESVLDGLQRDTTEIKGDVKTLLRDGGRP